MRQVICDSDRPVWCSNFLQLPVDCAVTFTVTRIFGPVGSKSYCIWIWFLSVMPGRFGSRSPRRVVGAELLPHDPSTLAVLAVPAVQRARERQLPVQNSKNSKNSKAPGAERAAKPGDLMQPISPRTTPRSPPRSAVTPLPPVPLAHVRPAAPPRPSGP